MRVINPSVKSMYAQLCRDETEAPNKKIGKQKNPLKVKIFMWLIWQNAILTKDNLSGKNWQPAVKCVLCSKNETTQHMCGRLADRTSLNSSGLEWIYTCVVGVSSIWLSCLLFAGLFKSSRKDDDSILCCKFINLLLGRATNGGWQGDAWGTQDGGSAARAARSPSGPPDDTGMVLLQWWVANDR